MARVNELSEGRESLKAGREVRKRARSIEKVVPTEERAKEDGKWDEDGYETAKGKREYIVVDGGGRKSILREKHVFVYFPSGANSLCFQINLAHRKAMHLNFFLPLSLPSNAFSPFRLFTPNSSFIFSFFFQQICSNYLGKLASSSIN